MSAAGTNGFDSWSDRGCTLVSNDNEDVIRCECSHLTSFGYLLVSGVSGVRLVFIAGDGEGDCVSNAQAIEPIPPENEIPLEVLLYVGCILSIVCLLVTFLTYAGSRSAKWSH